MGRLKSGGGEKGRGEKGGGRGERKGASVHVHVGNGTWTITLASSVSSINSVLFLRALVLRFFFTNLLSSAYSTLSFSVLFVFCLNSFLFLSKFSISVSSILFSVVDFCVWLCMVSIASLRTVFIFSIDGSSSFRVSNLFLVQFRRE